MPRKIQLDEEVVDGTSEEDVPENGAKVPLGAKNGYRSATIGELLEVLGSEGDKDQVVVFQVRDGSPVPEGFTRVPNHQIEQIWNALTRLSRLRLEGRDKQKKVVRLLRLFFDKPRKIYQDLKNQIIQSYPSPEGWESEALPVSVMEKRMIEIGELDDDTQDIKVIPKNMLLDESDLPKLIKGELGDQNQFGLGSIIHDLHFVYAGWPEDEKIEDGEDGAEKES